MDENKQNLDISNELQILLKDLQIKIEKIESEMKDSKLDLQILETTLFEVLEKGVSKFNHDNFTKCIENVSPQTQKILLSMYKKNPARVRRMLTPV